MAKCAAKTKAGKNSISWTARRTHQEKFTLGQPGTSH